MAVTVRSVRMLATAGAIGSGIFALMVIARPDDAAGPCVVTDRAALPEIPEASGLAISRRNNGIIWSHNDSGNAAILFALDASGALRGRVRVPVTTRDWEDISAGRCPAGDCLYIADIGDNPHERRFVRIYRVAEPAPGDPETARPEVFTARYADGAHNAEALFVVGEDLFVVTKDRAGGVYRSTRAGPEGRELILERIGELGLEAVTDAEASPDEATVVVRNSHVVVIYATSDITRGGVVRERLRIPIEGIGEPQGEGVALGANGLLYLASEGRPWSRGGLFLSLGCRLPEPGRQ